MLVKSSTIGNIANSERVHSLYNVTGKNIKIAIIDTGVDFSNLDMRHSLARDDAKHSYNARCRWARTNFNKCNFCCKY